MKRLFTQTLLLTVSIGTLWTQSLKAQIVLPNPKPLPATSVLAPWASAVGGNPEDARVSSTHTDASSGLEFVYVQQLYRGIPLYNRVVTLAFTKNKLMRKAGTFVPQERLAGLAATPQMAASAAVLAAVQPLQKQSGKGSLKPMSASTGPEARQTFAAPGLARQAIVASLVWATDSLNQFHLAWNVNIDVVGSADWLNIRVDAATGAIIGQDNWTVHEASLTRKRATSGRHLSTPQAAMAHPTALLAPTAGTTASYYVIPYPKTDPTGISFQTETDPWLKAGTSNSATTYGWQFDGTTTYTTTHGNNVLAYDDAASTNAPGNYAPSLTALPTLDFTYVHDFNQSPKVVVNRNNATVNLFYWNNITHDVMYQYGFTEASGNFQTNNLSRGGAQADAVRAESQDGSGTNNANFSTPVDGQPGRMQMFLFDGPPTTRVTAPSAIAGDYYSVESAFSTANKLLAVGPKSGALMYYTDVAGTHEACTANAAMVLTGKIAVIYRGTCGFTTKVKEAQTRGAIAVLMVNNQAGAPTSMGGTDNTITIPAVMVSQADGLTITNAMASGTVSVTLLATPQLDGDLDNGVVTHEYGHGVSTRLTGGPANSSCLTNAEQGGEGWSDYFALMLTTDWPTAQLTDGPAARPVGNYVVGKPATGGGIRRYPYSTSLSINPLTYANMAASTEVHNIGEIWCVTLWDMTWNIIQQQGTIESNLYNSASTGGNSVALQLVMLGLKLQPCQPGYLDARDAILAADDALYNGKYHCAIWRAFGRRGMGVSAVQGLSTNATDQVAAYDVPGGVQMQKAAELAGNTFTITINATCNCQVPLNNYSLADVLPAGLQYVSSTGGTLSGSTVTFSNLNFTTPTQTQTMTIQARTASGTGCALTYPVNDNRDASTVGGFTSSNPSGSITPWVVTSARYHTSANAWTLVGATRTSDVTLTSAAFTPSPASTLSFYHYYDYEIGNDGGTVELSTNNGSTWTDASAYFLQNGYNSTFPSSGLPCFSNASAATSTPADFIKSTLDLTAFSGTSLRVRFRSQANNSTASIGWTVDDVLVTNGCGGAQLLSLKDNTNTTLASSSIVTFLTPAPLPVVLLGFDAQWQAGGTQLTWATASEQNTSQFVVERSLDGSAWATAGTVAAAGNSSRQSNYAWLDAAALAQPAGLLYYRLRQVDRDGSAHFAPVRTVSRPAGTDALVLTVHPNPMAAQALHLTLAAPEAQTQALLRLIDATGRELWHEQVMLAAGAAALDWPKVAGLPAGLYLVRAQLPDGRHITVRVVRE